MGRPLRSIVDIFGTDLLQKKHSIVSSSAATGVSAVTLKVVPQALHLACLPTVCASSVYCLPQCGQLVWILVNALPFRCSYFRSAPEAIFLDYQTYQVWPKPPFSNM